MNEKTKPFVIMLGKQITDATKEIILAPDSSSSRKNKKLFARRQLKNAGEKSTMQAKKDAKKRVAMTS